MKKPQVASLYFAYGFRPEYTMLGECLSAAIRFSPAEVYIPVVFVSPDFLASYGDNPVNAEVNMVVIPEVTEAAMQNFIEGMEIRYWASRCYAFTQEEVDLALANKDWPPRPPARNQWCDF